MELDLLKAILTILKSCESQKSCKNCPLRELCGKMPCEW